MFTKVYLNVKIKIELFGKTELVRNPNKLKPYRGYYRNGYSLVMTLMSFAKVTSVGLALESLGGIYLLSGSTQERTRHDKNSEKRPHKTGRKHTIDNRLDL
jgi:hypothetical protein